MIDTCAHRNVAKDRAVHRAAGPLIDKLLVIADDGRLVMVDATPEAYKEVGQIQAVKGKAWTTPAFSNGRVYVRSAEEGACLDLTVSAK